MQYNDNPRKVYGKVKIIYSDTDISNILNVGTSGNGSISEPEQVYKGFISPTIKACTMDGNATMGSGFQMNDTGLISGWWGAMHSNDIGEFITAPYLSLTFIARLIVSWTIIGDDKLNQYPVEFDVIAYCEDIVVNIKEIRGNNQVSKTLWYEEPLSNITKMELIIYKWNIANAKVKILQFFDILEEEYGADDIKEFEVLEELCAEGQNYSINSDSASFTIYNRARKFDKGYLKSLLLIGRKVIPYIGIEKEHGIEYTKLGTFYSEEWRVPQSDQWIKVTCIDKIMKLQDITYIGYPYTIDATLYEIAQDIIEKAGFDANEYYIDEELNNDIVYNCFIQKCSCWEALQKICYGGLCNAFIDRDDVLRITKNKVNATDISIEADSILSYDRKTTLTNFSNFIEVSYIETIVTDNYITAYEQLIGIDPESIITLNIDYITYIADAFLSFTPSTGIELVEIKSGINAAIIVLRNNNATYVTTTL